MATGAYDANGIWNYGEDDNIALFSDLLNLATESTSDAFTDDRARLATLEAGSLAGLIPVVPTSVDKTGGTSSVSSKGTVTFSGVSAISLNGVFTTTYTNYLFLYKITSTANSSMYFQLRAGGVTNAAASYYWGTAGGRTNGVAVSPGGSASAVLNWSQIYSPSMSDATGAINIYQPKNSSFTQFSGSFWGSDGTSGYGGSMGGMFGSTYAADGFTITPSTGTYSGTLQILGYNS